MTIFWVLFYKILPLYFIIVLGYIAEKYLAIKKESIATMIIYLIAPVVVFYGIISKDFSVKLLLVPILLLTFSSIISLTFLKIGKYFWSDHQSHLLAFATGAGNTGYFGLPVAILLFGKEALQVAIFGILGTVFFEATVGFYLLARGNFSAKKSLHKLLRLPLIHACLIGGIVNATGYRPSENLIEFFSLFRGAYSILGMMIIGMALGHVKRTSFDFKFISMAMLARLVCWPILTSSFIWIDFNFLHIYNYEIYQVLVLLSVVPIAANTITFATELNIPTEKAAIAIIISTLLALFIIPLLVQLSAPAG